MSVGIPRLAGMLDSARRRPGPSSLDDPIAVFANEVVAASSERPHTLTSQDVGHRDLCIDAHRHFTRSSTPRWGNAGTDRTALKSGSSDRTLPQAVV